MSVQMFLEQTQHLARRPDEKWGEYGVCFRDFRAMKLNIESPFLPVLIHPNYKPAAGWPKLLDDLVLYSREKRTKAPVVFLTDESLPSGFDEYATMRQHSIAILDRGILSTFAAGRDWNQKYLTLGRALARGVGLSTLHPYVPGEPASGCRFFGRTKYVEEIVSGRTIHNCTIVGNRRIGKTSLMQEVKDRLKEVYIENKTIFFADLYAAHLKSTWDAVYMICSQLDISVPKSQQKLGAISQRYIMRLPKLLHKFARDRGAAVVIFIDEFDRFLDIDSKHDYQFLDLLCQTATAKADCYVIIAGFRRLMEARVSQESPYFNFTSEISLAALTREETLDMVTIPLARLGIDTASTNLPKIIYDETRGQPEMIQMYCRAAVELYQKSEGRIPVDAELLNYVHKNPAFARAILHTFMNNTNPYEQLICLLLIQRALQEKAITNYVFTAKDVEDLRIQLEMPLSNAQTATLLNNLVVGSIIERVMGAPGKYRFTAPQLLRFCGDLDIFSLIGAAHAEAKRNPPTIHALNMDTPEAPQALAAGKE